MPKNVRNHQITAPDGTTHRRSSQSRTYSHAVVGIRSIETDTAYVNRLADMNGTASNFEWYKSKGDLESLMGATTVDQYREAVRARGMARIEERKAAGDYARYVPLAWCGRLDLAQKEMARHMKSPQYDSVAIVEAVII